MEPAEVVVTGIGMVTPLGATARASAEAWRDGRCAARATLPDLAGTSLERAEVAVLPEFDPADRLGSRRMLKYMSDAAVLGCVAAHEAMADADAKRRFRPERIGLFAGSGLAAASVKEVLPMVRESIGADGRFSCQRFGSHGLAATNPLLSFKILANMPPCIASMIEGVKGPNFIFTPWEGQTAAALYEAWRAVAAGEVDCALAGAADNAAHPATFVYLKQAGLLRDEEYPAPGAAYLVFERAETAEKASLRSYAHIAHMELRPSDGPARDPLAPRMGRSFAAMPAILLALACQISDVPVVLCGVDRQEFRVELRTAEPVGNLSRDVHREEPFVESRGIV
jgi:3-oxoacyl-(acyl-carrier-protein) synthase